MHQNRFPGRSLCYIDGSAFVVSAVVIAVIAIDMETMEVVFGLYPEDKIVAVVAVIGLLVVHAIVIPIVSVAEPSADHLGKDSNGIA